MALVGSTESFYTYKNDTAKYKRELRPAMTSNGTWMAEGTYSCRGSSSLRYESNLYKVFNGQYYSSDVSDFNENIYIDICLPKAIALRGADMYSYYQALPATGIVYYSDDGETYTECGTWKDETTTSQKIAVGWDNVGAHRIWRFVSSSRSNKYPTKNADITYASLWYYEYLDLDYSLPEGAGGFNKVYAMHISHNGVDIRQQDVFVMYKRDDLVNLWEGRDDVPIITGGTEAYVTHKPHGGLDIRQQDAFIQYRPHDGVDIRKLEVFLTNRTESKIDTFKIPYGIGGYVSAYAIYRVLLLTGYLLNLTDVKLQGIAIENNYLQLKEIETINKISLKNNTTEDLIEGEEDDEKEG